MAKWNFDPAHTSASFAARHMMVTTVRGQFKNITGTLDFDPDKPEATSVEVVIDTASMSSTGNEDRDNHLRSPDFLDIEKYPTIRFKSTGVEVKSDTRATLKGDLTIRDVTRPVAIEVEHLGQGQTPFGTTVAGFEGTTRINREDFGLTWNMALESGGWLVGKEIKIALDGEAVLAEEAVAG
jgi:polyisoprenoid-binding protein YceI